MRQIIKQSNLERVKNEDEVTKFILFDLNLINSGQLSGCRIQPRLRPESILTHINLSNTICTVLDGQGCRSISSCQLDPYR